MSLEECFTNDLGQAVAQADVLFLCTAHREYASRRAAWRPLAPRLEAVVDGCNLYSREDFAGSGIEYAGIGRGRLRPSPEFIEFVRAGFDVVERGVSNEVHALLSFLNTRYAGEAFERVAHEEVRRLAGTCVTGCRLASPGPTGPPPAWRGFTPQLAALAADA